MPATEKPLKSERWDLLLDGDHSPSVNMALDEALLLTAPRRGRPLLRFYGWDRPAVSIGYVQRYDAAPEGVEVVRRPTGGGVVYHDHDFTYTVVIPAGHWLTGLDRTRSYDWINRSVQDGLEQCNLKAHLADADIPHTVDRLTMVCFQNPTRYDILMDGVKVAGSAQRRLREGLLHQGSIHFGGPLPISRNKLADALLDGFRNVLNIETIPFILPADVRTLAGTLGTERYNNDAWNHRR
jgi:lipoate-protein ligase A